MEDLVPILFSVLIGGIATLLGFMGRYYLDKKRRVHNFEKEAIEEYIRVQLEYELIFEEYRHKLILEEYHNAADPKVYVENLLMKKNQLDYKTSILITKSTTVLDIVNRLTDIQHPSKILHEFITQAKRLNKDEREELRLKCNEKFISYKVEFAIISQQFLEKFI